MSDTSMTEAQSIKLEAEIANLNAMTAKLHAETTKLNTENRWYLLIVGSGATLAIVAFAGLFLN
jgi:cellobiose-specific phosphotransferase system component IIC